MIDQLKYLSGADYQKYIEAIVTYREHCVHDPKYIRVVHHQYLARDPSEKKKNVLCVSLLLFVWHPSKIMFSLDISDGLQNTCYPTLRVVGYRQ